MQKNDMTAIIDPGDAAPVIDYLSKHNISPTHILCTHHHWDHTGGNEELKAKYNCTIIGPKADQDRIPGIDIALAEGEKIDSFTVIDVPGHTRGHIAFYSEIGDVLFSGDTLFSIGCGRLFEGTPQQMWHSLCKLRALPDRTRLYCGHEYTMDNIRFALSIDPDNETLRLYEAQVRQMREDGRPSLPASLGIEKKANPFLRADDPEFAKGLGSNDPVDVFSEMRRRKDSF